jgi:hypothetical protein
MVCWMQSWRVYKKTFGRRLVGLRFYIPSNGGWIGSLRFDHQRSILTERYGDQNRT